MSDLSEIRDAIKTTLEAAISGLRVYTDEPDGVLEYPCLIIEPTESINYNRVLGSDSIRVQFNCGLYVAVYSNEEGWDEINEYRSPTGSKSIRAAIKASYTLGGVVNYAEVALSDSAAKGHSEGVNFWEFWCRFVIDVIAFP